MRHLFLLALLGCASNAGNAMTYDDAVALLDSPATWCRGAEQLTSLGDRSAVVPLLNAYESREESSKLCLLDALDALGAGEEAHRMWEGSAEDRRRAAHIMELLADESHLAYLEKGAVDQDQAVRRQSLRAIGTQVQSPGWEAAMIRLLSAGHTDTRAEAIKRLSRRKSDAAREALRARLAVETDATLRSRLEDAVTAE